MHRVIRLPQHLHSAELRLASRRLAAWNYMLVGSGIHAVASAFSVGYGSRRQRDLESQPCERRLEYRRQLDASNRP